MPLTNNQTQKYKTNVDEFVEKKRYESLIATLGPKGKVTQDIKLHNEYNAIEMDIPKGLDEKLVTAIIIGAMMDPTVDGMDDYQLTGSNPDVRRVVDSNQNYVIDNVTKSDSRTHLMEPIIVEARKKAKAALEAFKRNDPEPAKELLQNFIDFEARNVDAVRFINTKAAYLGNYDQAFSNSGEGLALAAEIMGKEPLNVMPKIATPIQVAKLKCYDEEVKALHDAGNKRHSLVNDLNMLSKNIKAERAADLLFDLYIANINVQMHDRERKVANDLFYGYITQLGGPDGRSDELDEQTKIGSLMDNHRELHTASEDMVYSVKKYNISNIEAILASPGGYDKLKRLYISSIKKSPEYAAIVNANNQLEMIEAINGAESVCSANITEKFPNVKLPDMASAMNKEQNEKLSKDIKTTRAQIEKNMADYIKENNAANALYMVGVTPEVMKNNATMIDELVSNIKGVNYRGGSQNFKDMYEALKNFRDYAKSLGESGKNPTAAEMQEYINLGQKVSDLTSKYLDNKTKTNSDYARSRVIQARKLKKYLVVNLTSAKEIKDECLRNDLGDMYDEYKAFDKYDIQNNKEQNLAFRSGIYKPDRQIPRGSAGYSTARSAVQSTALMALAVTGKYSIDDLLDADKFVNEKTAMFDQVTKKMAYNTPENQKWLAEMMVKGMEKTKVMIDEKLKTFDLNDPKVFDSDIFRKIEALQLYRTDIWQEVEHCKDAVSEVAKSVHNDFTTYKNYSDKLKSDIGVIGNIKAGRDHMNIAIQRFVENPLPEREDMTNNLIDKIISNAFAIEMNKKALRDKLKSAEGKSYSELNNRMEAGYLNYAELMFKEKAMTRLENVYKKHPDLLKEHIGAIMSGEFFKDISIKIDPSKPDPVEISGIDKLISNVKSAEFLKDAEAATKRLETGKYKNHEDYYRDSSLAIVGGIYKLTGSLPKKTETVKQISLEEFSEKNYKSPEFRRSLKSSRDPGKNKNPKTVAAIAKDPAKLRKIIETNNKHEMERQKANGPEVLKDNPVSRQRKNVVTGKKMGKNK